jgi:hypothetical protein
MRDVHQLCAGTARVALRLLSVTGLALRASVAFAVSACHDAAATCALHIPLKIIMMLFIEHTRSSTLLAEMSPALRNR